MTRSIETRLAKLENARGVREAPRLIFGSEALPDEPLTSETAARWIREGLAYIGFGGRAIFYDGGRRNNPLTVQEWEARYSPLGGAAR